MLFVFHCLISLSMIISRSIHIAAMKPYFIDHCAPRFQHRDIENRLVVAKMEEGREAMGWKFGINRCKPLYIE